MYYVILSHYDPCIPVFRVQAFQKTAGMLGAQCLKGQWGEVWDVWEAVRWETLRNSHIRVGMQTTVCKAALCKEPWQKGPLVRNGRIFSPFLLQTGLSMMPTALCCISNKINDCIYPPSIFLLFLPLSASLSLSLSVSLSLLPMEDFYSQCWALLRPSATVTENVMRGMAGDPTPQMAKRAVRAISLWCIVVECRDSKVVIADVVLEN